MQIDYYLAAVSPWCYLAGARPAEIAARHGARLRYVPVDPAQLFARTGGKVLAERHENRRAYRLQELRRWAQVLDRPIRLDPPVAAMNPAPAAYAILSAQAAVEGGAPGDLDALVLGLVEAVWAQARDIADAAVIADVLAAYGFDPAVADRGMLAAAEAYAAGLDAAVARGVFGLPTFAVGEELFWGQDRLDHLDLHLAGRLSRAPG